MTWKQTTTTTTNYLHMNNKRGYCAAATIDCNQIIVVGGRNRSSMPFGMETLQVSVMPLAAIRSRPPQPRQEPQMMPHSIILSTTSVGATIPENVEWTALQLQLTEGRYGHGMAIDGNNCLYLTGGYTRTGYTDLVERYDLRNNTVTRLKPLPVKVQDCTCEMIDLTLYVFGGLVEGYGASDRGFALNLARPDSEWRELPTMPHKRDHASSFVIDGNIYIIGVQIIGVGFFRTTSRDYMDVFDTTSQKWASPSASILPLLQVRSSASAILHRGKYLAIVGGRSKSGDVLNAVEIIDIAAKQRVTTTALRASPLVGCATAIVGDNMFVVGGSDTVPPTKNFVQNLICCFEFMMEFLAAKFH
uniref:Uncharacterized protein n=2 Tax=Cyclophora tenuis TaxID=216820 RepID=A0A7S1CYV2_CYCTE|eukprot:CAMPEP_0116549548 /NCGR_PEP_ID=MMETSP0397-20121206/4941_1 /TAXON_ID=216820 /ORGANISM="Cyclophora tenuis, Strain ECT3854" /LENGTH=359 /DNA_ID=CAMNT_0004074297 /DNA_START=85 /DNA_END=1167 /DNA_ORIENTATION=+